MSAPAYHDPRLEQLAIANRCYFRDDLAATNTVPADLFLSPARREVWAWLLEHEDVCGNEITVRSRAQAALSAAAWSELVAILADRNIAVDSALVDQVVTGLRRNADSRRAAMALEGASAAITKGADPARVLGDLFASYASEVGEPDGDTLDVIFRRALKAYDERCSGKRTGLSTGLPGLDALLGGWRPGNFYILGARTSVGKTLFLLSGALQLAEAGHWVRYYSLEMSEGEIDERMLAALSGISNLWIRDGVMPSERQQRGIAEGAERAKAVGARLVVERRKRSIGLVQADVIRFARQGRCNVAIVDYLQLLDGESRKNEQRYRELARISRALATLATTLGIVVIGVAQLGRDAAHREPSLTDLRESGDLEQDARGVLLLHRPALQGSSDPPCLLDVLVEKNSGGELGRVRLHANLDRQVIEESASVPCRFCSGVSGLTDVKARAAGEVM